ncbi:MAG TPA: aminoacetone oxidase family FAD-binding enzyme, partial [Clostridia bacterium]|nr:aminoacetone oxidase family FAD-binding enzyme [Clostridia bacterium]
MTVAVIGGGASGLMAAQCAAQAGAQVLVLEQQARVGKKILSTGNGRCNLLNARVAASAYHGSGAEVAAALLHRHPPRALLDHFEQMGLLCREEEAGRVYPASGHAGAVLDVLRAALQELGAQVRTDCTVTALNPCPTGFRIRCADGASVNVQRVIVSTGGRAGLDSGAAIGYELLSRLGHALAPLRPALAPLTTPFDAVRGLKGVRVQATLRLRAGGKVVRTELGELLFADAGLSGVAAMQCARLAGDALAEGRSVEACVDLLPERSASAWGDWLKARALALSERNAASLLSGLVHPRIALRLLALAGVRPDDPGRDCPHGRLGALLREWALPVTGTLGMERAQVTAGGALLESFDPETL